MVLGQSATTATALALAEDIALQDVDYQALRKGLLAAGQVLEKEGGRYSRKGSLGASK